MKRNPFSVGFAIVVAIASSLAWAGRCTATTFKIKVTDLNGAVRTEPSVEVWVFKQDNEISVTTDVQTGQDVAARVRAGGFLKRKTNEAGTGLLEFKLDPTELGGNPRRTVLMVFMKNGSVSSVLPYVVVDDDTPVQKVQNLVVAVPEPKPTTQSPCVATGYYYVPCYSYCYAPTVRTLGHTTRHSFFGRR